MPLSVTPYYEVFVLVWNFGIDNALTNEGDSLGHGLATQSHGWHEQRKGRQLIHGTICLWCSEWADYIIRPIKKSPRSCPLVSIDYHIFVWYDNPGMIYEGSGTWKIFTVSSVIPSEYTKCLAGGHNTAVIYTTESSLVRGVWDGVGIVLIVEYYFLSG